VAIVKQYKGLLEAALAAAETAHAPYSNFHVGASVLSSEGEIFSGANVESASYSLTLCAERVAIFKAVTSGHKKFTALAVTADDKKIPFPCGACLQVYSEFVNLNAPIFVREASKKKWHQFTLGQLLTKPFSFKKNK